MQFIPASFITAIVVVLLLIVICAFWPEGGDAMVDLTTNIRNWGDSLRETVD